MRILIIGSNARTGSARYSERFLTFAGLIAETHKRYGDEVQFRNWEPDILREGWGRIYVGLSSPAWIGSDRIYGSLATIAELRDGDEHDPRLRFFIDDPDLRVLRNAITSVAKDPSRILTPINVKRHNYHLVHDTPALRDKVVRGLELLQADELAWPTTFIPAFPWGDTKRLTSHLRPNQKAHVRSFDPTPLADFESYATYDEKIPAFRINPVGPYWITESSATDPWVKNTHVRSMVVTAKPGSDSGRVHAYRSALGVLEPQLSALGPGWWSAKPLLAAAAQTYYATDWRGLRDMRVSEPYIRALPGAYEEFNELEREMLIAEQKTALFASIGTVDEAKEALDVLVV